ncbi:19440_t:CDS:2 [Dentiscutata erythropus]|uniref:19440_t:CDS:1 n=1 Tax=Dentiscutata erythropus TaxID=1348616 RepID=A0A9N9AJ55_9GLOM|nr:19440_t:CDS:2 [Dentiscutata erythropus]
MVDDIRCEEKFTTKNQWHVISGIPEFQNLDIRGMGNNENSGDKYNSRNSIDEDILNKFNTAEDEST